MKAKSQNAIPKPSQFFITLGLSKYALRSTMRNRGSLVWGLLFPIIFVSIFGALGSSSGQINVGVADSINKNNTLYQAVEKTGNASNSPVKLITGSASDLENQLSTGKIDAVLEPGTSALATLKLVTTSADPGGQTAAEDILQGLVSEMNFQVAVKEAGPQFVAPFGFQTKDIAGRTYRYIDFALPGQIGFSLLSLATFGVAFSFIALRRTLVLKRMFATSVKPLSFVISQCLARSVQAILQAAVILLFGMYAFHFDLAHGWTTFVEMMLISVLGILSFLGFGIFISNIAKDEQTAPIVINLFNLPQILLAGVFFTTDSLPKWVQYIGNNLPLSYFNTAMRDVATNGASFHDIYLYLLGMVGWGLIAYILAAKTFKAE